MQALEPRSTPETPATATPAAAYLASLTTAVSRAGMESELRKIARIITADIEADWRSVDWGTLNAANVLAIMAKVDGAPASRNKTRAALRGVARAAWRLGLMNSDELERIEDVKPARGSRELAGRQVEGWELAALMRHCANDSTPAGARDGALFAVAAKTGARREELVRIAMRDITRTPDGFEIAVIGKGNKARTLYLDNGASLALEDWLRVRGDAAGALFCAVHVSGRINPAHTLTTTAAHKVLQRRAAAAGIPAMSWHDLRRTFAGSLLDAGEDISTVSQLMGHASVTTTARYDRRPAEARRRASRRISVPYFERAVYQH